MKHAKWRRGGAGLTGILTNSNAYLPEMGETDAWTGTVRGCDMIYAKADMKSRPQGGCQHKDPYCENHGGSTKLPESCQWLRA